MIRGEALVEIFYILRDTTESMIVALIAVIDSRFS